MSCSNEIFTGFYIPEMTPSLILDWLSVLCRASYLSYQSSSLTLMIKWCFLGVHSMYGGDDGNSNSFYVLLYCIPQCVYHISPLHPSAYLRLWHRELLSKSQAVFKITRSQKRGISDMIISIVLPPPKTVLNA